MLQMCCKADHLCRLLCAFYTAKQLICKSFSVFEVQISFVFISNHILLTVEDCGCHLRTLRHNLYIFLYLNVFFFAIDL